MFLTAVGGTVLTEAAVCAVGIGLFCLVAIEGIFLQRCLCKQSVGG